MILPAEWAPQSAVQLTWPHANTDWAGMLAEAEACYIDMAREISLRETLIIVTPEPDHVAGVLEQQLPEACLNRIRLFECPTDDTWARDHGFITLYNKEGEAQLLDFRFNGWGQKFAAGNDNQICRRMADCSQALGMRGTYKCELDFTLEGGSIESDGCGTLLTTTECLMAPNRNEPLSQAQIEAELKRRLGAQRVLWLDHGYLAGDDTDSHVDTLARLCPEDTIAYVQCLNPEDEHFLELHLMEEQLKTFRTGDGRPYRLVPLPMAATEYDDEGQRLPATYANFLVVNGAVLMPTYGHAELDNEAKRQLQKAFPQHEIVGINCRVLIEQHGSLHCCTMQFPEGVF
ncbi:MAG: agmatine deiminase family protein [Prevotellaceae bacterium]|nr:agmatine deiminase family protein [Prevotellaceae bacterium]